MAFQRKAVVYTLALAFSLWAGRLDLQVKVSVNRLSQEIHKVLKVTALAMMETNEKQELEGEAVRAWNTAHSWEQKASQAASQSQADAATGDNDRQRGEYFEKVAAKEEEVAEKVEIKAEDDERMHVALLANVSLDVLQEQDELKQLKRLNSGVCSVRMVKKLCDALGQAASLQHEVDQEALQIHQEWLLAQKTGHQEYMEEVVAQILQGKASEYNRTATALLTAAGEWDKRSEYDLERAAAYNVTAMRLVANAEHLEQREHDEEEWVAKNRSTAQHLRIDLVRDHQQIARDSALAVVVALPAIFFFTFRLVVGLMSLFSTWELQLQNTDGNSDILFYRRMVNAAQHVFIFLFVVGLIGRDFCNMHLYETRQCGGILLRFVLQAALLQGFFLQALPHAMLEWPFLDRCDLIQIGKNFGRRFVSLTFLFSIEVLLAWLLIGRWLFAVETVAFYGSTIFRMVALVAMLVEVLGVGPRTAMVQQHDGQSTVLTEDDDASAFQSSELSPLTNNVTRDESLKTGKSPTDALVGIALGGAGRHGYASVGVNSRDTTLSSNSTPYSVSLKKDFLRLVLPFEALVMCCMIAVFRHCLNIASVDGGYLFRYLAAVSLVIVALVVWMCRESRATTSDHRFVIPDTVKLAASYGSGV